MLKSPPHSRVTAALLLYGLLTVAAGAQLAPGLIKVRAEGIARGAGPRARAQAVGNAEQKAIALYLRTVLGANKAALIQPLLERRAAYIQSSRVIEHGRDDTWTRVLVEIYANEKALRTDAAIVLFPRLPEPPQVLFLFGEQALGATSPNFGQAGVTEAAFAASFRKAGFQVLDSAPVRALYTVAELARISAAGVEGAARFGRENRAGIVVVGIARTEAATHREGASIVRTKARLEVRATTAAGGAFFFEMNTEAIVNGANPAEAARQALLDAADKALPGAKVEATLAMAVQPPAAQLWVTIEGPGSRPRLEAIVRRLNEIDGVREVEELRHSETTARLRVRYEGAMKNFVQRLTGRAYNGFSLTPRAIAGEEVSLRLELPL